MKCANCSQQALYVYDVPATETLYYCNDCLPSFLRVQAKAGLLPTTDAYAAAQAEVADLLAPTPEPVVKKKSAKAAATPVADESIDEVPAEA